MFKCLGMQCQCIIMQIPRGNTIDTAINIQLVMFVFSFCHDQAYIKDPIVEIYNNVTFSFLVVAFVAATKHWFQDAQFA